MRLTNEEKALKAILDAVSDVRVDMSYLGFYLAQAQGPDKQRFLEMLEHAEMHASADLDNDELEGTPFAVRAELLAEVWLEHRDLEELEAFISYNDLGLPLAYAYTHDIAAGSESLREMVNDTWNNFLETLGLEDTGFSLLEEMGISESPDEDIEKEDMSDRITPNDWKDILPQLLEDHNSVSVEEAVNCLIGLLWDNGIDWSPYGETEALAQRIVWVFPDEAETVAWVTADRCTYVSSLTLEYKDEDEDGYVFPFENLDEDDFVFNADANGWEYIGGLSDYQFIEQLEESLGTSTMILPWERIAENISDNEEEDFISDFARVEEDDEEGAEFAKLLFQLYSQVADGSFEMPDEIGSFGYDFGDGYMPRYSRAGRFNQFLADLEEEHNWGIVYDECCGTCSRGSVEDIQREEGKENSPVFITWAQNAEGTWGTDGSVNHMAYHPDEEEVVVIKQVAEANGLHVLEQNKDGKPDGFVYIS